MCGCHTATGVPAKIAVIMLRRLSSLLPRCTTALHAWCPETLACSCSSNFSSRFGAETPAGGSRQHYHSSSSTWHGGHSSDEDENVPKVHVTFVDRDGTEHQVEAKVGKHLLEVAHDNDIDLEGACEASLACSTCHVIVEDDAFFQRMPEATEDELDMLDLAFGLTDTSRLGCQVVLTPELDGLRVRIPSATRNFYVDGHVPKPH